MRSVVSSCLVVAALCGASGAWAQDTSDNDAALGAVREMIMYARYEEALAASRGLLARTDISARQRNETLEILAIAQLALRDRRGAEATLQELFGRDPDHRLVDRSSGPTVQAAFDRARESHHPPVHVVLENASPARMAQRQAPLVTVRILEHADAIDELRLSYRQGHEGAYAHMTLGMSDDRSTARARLAAVEGDDGYTVGFFVEALAPSRATIGTLGSGEEPLELAVPEASLETSALRTDMPLEGPEAASTDESGGGVLTQWWFWTAVGVVVAGGVATFLVLGPLGGGSELPTPTLGTGVLP